MSLAVPFGSVVYEAMKRLPDKLLELLEAHDIPQSKAARAIEVDPSQFSKWTKGQGKPTIVQLLLLSRYLGVPMEYFCDDHMTVIPSSDQLTEDERIVVRIFHSSGLTAEEAVERLLIKKLGIHPR